jgi:DNA-binding PadR family transcriptional regulator
MTEPTIEIQNLTRSCNEALILGVLLSGAKHGYQLALEIEELSEGAFRFNHGTLYPILHKLEKDGFIKGAWDEDSPRRKRKIYVLTKAGRRHVAEQSHQWRRFFKHFFAIVEGDQQ